MFERAHHRTFFADTPGELRNMIEEFAEIMENHNPDIEINYGLFRELDGFDVCTVEVVGVSGIEADMIVMEYLSKYDRE